MTDDFDKCAIDFQTAEVSRILVSSDKLSEKDTDVVLSRKNPRIITSKGRVIKLTRKKYLLYMWVWVPDDDSELDGNTGVKGETIAPVFAGQGR